MKKFFVSAIMGILAMCAVNLLSGITGVSVPVSALSVASSAVLGIPGLIAVLVLNSIIPK